MDRLLIVMTIFAIVLLGILLLFNTIGLISKIWTIYDEIVDFKYRTEERIKNIIEAFIEINILIVFFYIMTYILIDLINVMNK